MSFVGKLVGNYKVTSQIGEGGMGAVFLGEHPMIGKKVAIKTLHAELAQKEDIVSRFFTEAKAVNDIGHPNIVDIVDFGKMPNPDGGGEIVYLIMEFLDGEGLNSRLKREGVSSHETVHVMRQCVSALAASHRKGIIHRDLKPENIFLIRRADDKNFVKLLDFGIAKITGGEGGVSQHKTRTGLVIGTPSYMSPEQCEGRGLIDARSDVYSIGVVMYEMLTGRVPFPGDGFGEILVAHLTREPELPSALRPEVPPGLEAIVMHAMEKDKNRRFQSMEEMLAALENPLAHLETWGSPSGRMEDAAAELYAAPGAGVRVPTGQGARTTGQGGATARTTGEGPRTPTGQGPRATGPGGGPTTGQGGRTTGQGGVQSTGPGTRPTTLSGASGEVAGDETGDAPPPPAQNRTALFAVLGLLVVAGSAGAAFTLKGKSAGGTTAAHDPIAPAVIERPKAAETVAITIHSTPEGAKVIRAGVAEPVGVTPYKLESKVGTSEFDVVLKLDGYKDESRTVTSERSREILVPLTKLDAPAPTPTPSAPTPASPVAGGDRGKKPGVHHPAAAGGKAKGGGEKGAGDKDDVMAPQF